jgi:hypothetical protein
MISSIVLAAYMYYTNLQSRAGSISAELISKLMVYPLAFSGIGVLACMVGIVFLLSRKASDHPHKELNMSTNVSALLTILGNGVFTWFFLQGQDATVLGFKFGALSPWMAAVGGNLAGILVGNLAERFTSFDFKPTQLVSEASREGTALNITQGMAVGMKSVFFPVMVLAAPPSSPTRSPACMAWPWPPSACCPMWSPRFRLTPTAPSRTTRAASVKCPSSTRRSEKSRITSTRSATPPPPSARASRLARRHSPPCHCSRPTCTPRQPLATRPATR